MKEKRGFAGAYLHWFSHQKQPSEFLMDLCYYDSFLLMARLIKPRYIKIELRNIILFIGEKRVTASYQQQKRV